MFDRVLNMRVVFILFFERLESGAKKIWYEIFH